MWGIGFYVLACGAFASASRKKNMGVVQVVDRIPSRRAAQVSAISPPGKPRVHLMLPAAKELAAKAPGGRDIGASGLKGCFIAYRRVLRCFVT